jgi:hypothetical protein
MKYPASPLTPFPPTFQRNLFTSFADVSPSSRSLFPAPNVYPSLFCRPFVFNRLRTLYFSCASFSHSDCLFSIASALFDKNTGGGIALPSPLSYLRPLLPSHPLFVSTFRMNTCKSVSKQRTLSGIMPVTQGRWGRYSPV